MNHVTGALNDLMLCPWEQPPSTFNITIARNGNNIEGVAADKVISDSLGVFLIYGDGTDWWIIGT